MPKLLFLHGYESSGHGFKAQFLRGLFPQIHTPTFSGELEERMEQLEQYIQINEKPDTLWTFIGSSFGGLMATFYAYQHPVKISRLILFAPALIEPYLPSELLDASIKIPTLIVHGQDDLVVPLEQVQSLAQKLFHQLEFRHVTDTHRLHATVRALDWEHPLSPSYF